MPDLLLELFSEEIPARFQESAEESLKKLFVDELFKNSVSFDTMGSFSTPRRLVLVVTGLPQTSKLEIEEKRGPSVNAGDKAVQGFTKSLNIERGALYIKAHKKGDFYFARIEKGRDPIANIVSQSLFKIINNFPWPNSMRWGSKKLKWVRPLKSILCLLYDENQSEIVPLNIDGITSQNVCFGHRSVNPNKFAVASFDEYAKKLKLSNVILDRNSRKAKIWNEATTLAFAKGMEVVSDENLLNEVAGLVEWPVILWGEIQKVFQDLPTEVLQVSMREHQKFFSVTRTNSKKIISYISVANIDTCDAGVAIAAGNNKVLRARLEDAKFFWEKDLQKIRLSGFESFGEKLKEVTFHNQIGSEYDRVSRIKKIAVEIAKLIGADMEKVKTAASLCKLDLVSEMVYEFPELQGTMGKYYALETGFPKEIAEACLDHYAPKGPTESVPDNRTSLSIALADKIDLITNFWAINQKPTGSKDPFAIRRAAIGIVRILLERRLDLSLDKLIQLGNQNADFFNLLDFFRDRIRVFLSDEGIKADIVNGCFSASGENIFLTHFHKRALAIQDFINTGQGKDLVQTYKRAVNILTLEEKKDGVEYSSDPKMELMTDREELNLYSQLQQIDKKIVSELRKNDFENALSIIASLKETLDSFFEKVKINSGNLEIRRNRLCMLSQIRSVIHRIAKFSEIEVDS